MKIADSYLSKQNFLRASKQLQKVIKSSPNYLPARIGYATSLEGLGAEKNAKSIALAYADAAKVALTQDPLKDYASSKEGEGGMAEAILRRALDYAKSVPKKDRIQLLQSLLDSSHTASLAADIHYFFGKELLSSEDSSIRERAQHAFLAANQYAELTSGNGGKGHGESLVELGKIALNSNNDPGKAQMLLARALDSDLDDVRVEALVLQGKAKKVRMLVVAFCVSVCCGNTFLIFFVVAFPYFCQTQALGDTVGAVKAFEEALELPTAAETKNVHHQMAIIFRETGGDFELAQKHLREASFLGASLTVRQADTDLSS